MDVATREMLIQAYDETVGDALGQGRETGVAHREGVTAAAMFLAALNGCPDEQALNVVEGLGLGAVH